MKFKKKAIKYLNLQKEGHLKGIFKRFKPRKITKEQLLWQLYIKPKLMAFLRLFGVLDRLPKSALFTLLIIFIFTSLMVNQHIVKEYWMNTVVEAFPDLTQAGVDAEGKVQLSPIDAIFTPSVARIQGYMWIFFWVNLGIIYGQIARGYIPRKCQTLPNIQRIRG